MSIWVLTEQYNDYDQHGEYFIHAWPGKPTAGQVAQYTHLPGQALEHVMAGGGRQRLANGQPSCESSWYYLHEITD